MRVITKRQYNIEMAWCFGVLFLFVAAFIALLVMFPIIGDILLGVILLALIASVCAIPIAILLEL